MGKFDITLIQTKESNEDSKEYKDAKRYLEEMQVANCILVADPDAADCWMHTYLSKKLSMELMTMGSFSYTNSTRKNPATKNGTKGYGCSCFLQCIHSKYGRHKPRATMIA